MGYRMAVQSVSNILKGLSHFGFNSLFRNLAVGIPFAIIFSSQSFAQPASSNKSVNSASPVPLSSPSTSATASSTSAVIPSAGATESPLHSVPPSSLLEMRLHPAALPLEAELSCSLLFGCHIGLTRGFVLGGDVSRTLGMTMLGQHFYGAGAWTYLDANVGYQFLRMSERMSTLMGTFGYRTLSYKNSEGAKLARSGIAFRTAYAESVLPAYTQGLVFEAFSSPLDSDGGANQPFTRLDDKKVRNLIKEFAGFMRLNPLLRLQMPADLEVINWKPSQVDLPSSLRGYLRVNPTYEQTDIVLKNAEQTIYSWIEKRFALQLMLMTAYAAPEQKSGRLGLLGGLGFEMAASKLSIDSKAPTQDLNPDIPTAPLVRGKLEIQATYQF